MSLLLAALLALGGPIGEVEEIPGGSSSPKGTHTADRQSYFMLSQSSKAIPWLEKLPGSTEANYMLGYAYLQIRQPKLSEEAFSRLFGVNPDSGWESCAGSLV